MENNNQNPQEEGQQIKKHKPDNKKLVAYIVIIFLVFTIGLFAMSYFFQEKNNHKINKLANNLSQLQNQQQEDLQNGNQAIQTLVKEQQNIQREIINLNKNFKNIQSQYLNQSGDFILLKARYYVELAQINAYWTKDFQASAALLKEADLLLANTNEQNLFAVRRALTEQINQINSTVKIDKIGLLTKLDSAITLANNLPLKNSPKTSVQNFTEKLDTENNLNPSSWQERIKQNLLQLKKLVVIKQIDNDANIILPSQEALLRLKLTLTLKQIQWATLQENQIIFEHSLNDAIEQITNFFDTSNQSTITLLQELENLKSINFTSEKPDFQLIIKNLNEIINNKEPLNPVNNETHAKIKYLEKHLS